MPWTDVTTAVPGTVYTAARRNTEVRDNLAMLRTGGFAVTGQAAGDVLVASGASQFVRSTNYGGPVAFGGSAQGFAQHRLTGAFAPTTSHYSVLSIDGTSVSLPVGYAGFVQRIYSNTVTRAASGTHSAIGNLRIEPVTIAGAGASTVTDAWTVEITGAPTTSGGGAAPTSSGAFKVSAGNVVFGGNLRVGSVGTPAYALDIRGVDAYLTGTTNTAMGTINTGSGSVIAYMQALTGGPVRIGSGSNHNAEFGVNNSTYAITLTTSGTATANLSSFKLTDGNGVFYERNRSNPLGGEISKTYSAGDFTALAPMGLTVASGDVSLDRYFLVNRLLFWEMSLANVDTTGSASNEIQLTLPGGFQAGGLVRGTLPIQISGTWETGSYQINAGTSVMRVYRAGRANYPVGTDVVNLGFCIHFGIN